MIVTRHRSRPGTVQLTAVEIRKHGGVCEVDSSDAPVVVVHGDVQHTAAHLHRDGVAVGHVVGRICGVGRPSACAVSMRDDPLLELAKVVEFCTADDQVGTVGPQFIEDVAGIPWQTVPRLPRAVPCVGDFVVSGDTVFGGEHGFAVVFHDAPYREFEVVPRIDERLTAVVEVQLEFTPCHPRVAVGGPVARHSVDGTGGQDVRFVRGRRGVPASDAARTVGVPPLSGDHADHEGITRQFHADDVATVLSDLRSDVEVGQ